MFRDSSSLGLSPQDVDKLLCLAALVEISRRMDELWSDAGTKGRSPLSLRPRMGRFQGHGIFTGRFALMKRALGKVQMEARLWML